MNLLFCAAKSGFCRRSARDIATLRQQLSGNHLSYGLGSRGSLDDHYGGAGDARPITELAGTDAETLGGRWQRSGRRPFPHACQKVIARFDQVTADHGHRGVAALDERGERAADPRPPCRTRRMA